MSSSIERASTAVHAGAGFSEATSPALRRAAEGASSVTREDARSADEPLPPEIAWLDRLDPSRRLLRGRAYETVKRGLDIFLIIAAAPLILPVLLLCWIAVKAESPRSPAVFSQWRTGRNGRRFQMLKFRSMVPNAEQLKPALASGNQLRWPDFKIENDPRITRLGRLLRRTSLDELPQVFNVLKGDMSLVGPRPTSFGIETYEEWHKGRLRATPGLTGIWQIAGRGAMEFDDRVRLDLAYIEHQSLTVDLRILVRTLGAVLRRKGAY